MKKFHCRTCSFIYFHNTAAAAGVILEYGEQIVLIRRNREPAKGKLDLPGGFVDPDESAEEALRREVREELSIDLGALKYLGSYPNTYEYEGVTYKTCDLLFSSRIDTLPTVVDKTEIEELVLLHPSIVPDEHIAFESVRMGLRLFKKRMKLSCIFILALLGNLVYTLPSS
ncbi:MAG: NUDIX domain-containing protein [Sedimentisphaerales bacterium]|nr:NUDIX domain-containing protein [Sedimentisphaerales bacterium]